MKTLIVLAMLILSTNAHAEFNVKEFKADLDVILEEASRAADAKFAPQIERFKRELEAVKEIYKPLLQAESD